MSVTKEQALAKAENVKKTLNRQPHEWVPISPKIGTAMIDYAGLTYWDIRDDYDKLTKAIDSVMSQMPCDVVTGAGFAMNAEVVDIMNGYVQTFLSKDGITLQHKQASHMKGDEYPQATEDLFGFIKTTLLPRKLPFLFEEGVENAAKRLERMLEANAKQRTYAPAKLAPFIEEEYGCMNIGGGAGFCTTPGDQIMDAYRGFEGTLTDLRRHYSEMKEFADMLWEKRMVEHFDNVKFTEYKYANYPTHIPCFLSPKQYEELCFKYFKQQVENIAAGGSKLYMLSEGSWKYIIHYMNDLPQDSVLFNCEDDDICEAYDKIGAHQILIGGAKLVNTKLNTLEHNKDEVKRVIDHCAPGNAFIFSTDKAWCCKGDVTDTLIQTFQFAGEYGRK